LARNDNDEYASTLPSLDSETLCAFKPEVTRSGGPSSVPDRERRRRYTSRPPPRLETNSTLRPSGIQTGLVSIASPLVRDLMTPDARVTISIELFSVLPSMSSPSAK